MSQQGDLWPEQCLNVPVSSALHAKRYSEPLQQLVTDELTVIGSYDTSSSFFLTFTQLDLPLIGAPEAADFSTQYVVNTKFMNLPWLEGETLQEISICTSNKTISLLRIIKGNYSRQSCFVADFIVW